MTVRILQGDCREVLKTLPDESVHCVVTSPPYFGLRDYGVDGQMGLEPTPDEFIAGMVAVFRECWRVLRADGTCWINMGDSYNAGTSAKRKAPKTGVDVGGWNSAEIDGGSRVNFPGCKPKDLCGVPWMLAFALRADGWYLRQDIIWSKPNPMPESVRDRCTKAHEYLFLLSKSPRYHFDAEAIAEPITDSTRARLGKPTLTQQKGSDRVPGKTNGAMKAAPPRFGGSRYGDDPNDQDHRSCGNEYVESDGLRNKRSVWTIATRPFKEAHFATFPPALVEPCILAGCPEGGTVLDPFGGAGTTGLVADRLQRHAILIELNLKYVEIARRRIANDSPLLAGVTTERAA